MGFWKQLKKSLSGGGGGGRGDGGLYFYIRLKHSGEVVQLRLIPGQELVPDYETGSYFAHKTITGPRSFQRAEATFHFDGQRRFDRADITGGELTDEEAYRSQQEE
jgi:hypothetical protein